MAHLHIFSTCLGSDRFTKLPTPISYIPPNLVKAELIKVLKDIPPAYAQGLEAKLVEIKDVQLGDNPGLEFKFSRLGQTGLGRIYIVGVRLYIITSMGNSPKETSSFLNSFDLR